MELQERVFNALARACHLVPEQIRLDATFEELGIDSLTGLQVIFELEQEFKISIPESVAMGMRSVRDVVDRLAEVVQPASL